MNCTEYNEGIKMDKNYAFFALLDRMQYINRWALMRNSRYENIKEHSFDVAVIAQSLALIHNNLVDEGKTAVRVDPLLIATYGLYHDCTEIITGDMPTPIKYRNDTLKNAYKQVEREAALSLTSQLPDSLQELGANIFLSDSRLIAYVFADSAALQYCIDNNVRRQIVSVADEAVSWARKVVAAASSDPTARSLLARAHLAAHAPLHALIPGHARSIDRIHPHRTTFRESHLHREIPVRLVRQAKAAPALNAIHSPVRHFGAPFSKSDSG